MQGFLGAAARSFSGRILGAISALIAAYSVTSNLTVAESGLFFLSLGFAIFFSHFLRFGLDNFVLKKCAIFLSESSYKQFLSIVSASALICIVASLAVYFLIHASGWFISYEYMQYLLLAFPAAVAIALLGIISHTLHASGFVFTGSITNTSLHYLIFTALVWLLAPSDAIEVVWLLSVSSYAALFIQILVATFIYTLKGIKLEAWKEVKLADVDYQEIYRTTVPLWLVVVSQQLNQWGAQFMSSVYVAEEQLALLAIAMRISVLVPMVLTSVNKVVSPKFASHFHKGEIDKTEEILAKSLQLLSIVSLSVFVFMVFLGDDVLRVFGPEYTEASTLLTILVCGQLVNALTGPCGKLLMMSGFEKDVRNSSMIVAAIGVALAFYLTSQHGVYGAAIATALTIAIQNIAFAFLVQHRVGINLARVYLNFFRK